MMGIRWKSRSRPARLLPVLLGGMLLVNTPYAMAQQESDEAVWQDLRDNVFDGRPIEETKTIVALEAPYRAEDAALVPMTISLPFLETLSASATEMDDPVQTITLVIDRNPAPVAATFTLGDEAGVTRISTRMRVNSYTDIHAVAETVSGALYVDTAYVKASGGCSAPAGKNPQEALADLGKMKMRYFTPAKAAQPETGTSSALREAQLMIRHPNNSGLQMDQITQLYVPAHFVDTIEIRQGDALVLSMEGGISISENPNFRFTYRPNGADFFRVKATDTEGETFEKKFPITEPESQI